MKILFLSHYSAMLGANRSLFSLISGLKEKGVEVMVWCPKEGHFPEALREENIPIRILNYENWADSFLFPGYWLLPYRYLKNKVIFKRLVGEAKGYNPDIIHTNSSLLPIGAYLADELQLPHVWHIRELVYLQFNMRYFPGDAHFHKWLKKATIVIVISEWVKKEIIGNKSLPHKLIYNGVLSEQQLAQTPTTEPINKDTFTFLMIGMLHPKKNQILGLKAFQLLADEFPQARLLIVGKGRRFYEQKLRSFTKKHGLENQVEFAGYQHNPKISFEQSDVVLMCSKNEAMGRVTVEALAYGKPVIGNNSGATPELIDHGVDGFLFKNGPEEMAAHMRHFLRSPEQAKSMGAKGYEKAQQQFKIKDYVENMYQVFNTISKS